MMRRKLITMVAVAALVFTAACSGGGDDEESSSRTTTTEEATTTTSEETTTTTEEDSGTTTTTEDDADTTATTSGSEGTTTTTSTRTVCPETGNWNTRPDSESTNVLSVEPIYLFAAGRHDCYDQLTFVLNGRAPVGFHVAYGGEDDGIDNDETSRPVAGSAFLVVDIMAPNHRGPYDNSGHSPQGPPFAQGGDVLYSTSNPRGLRVIEEVVSAGEFESVATYVVGIDRQRRFAVTTDFNRDGNRVVIIRVAS